MVTRQSSATALTLCFCPLAPGSAESAGVRGHPLLEGARRAAGDFGDGRQHGGLIEGATGVELEERVNVLGGHVGQHLLPGLLIGLWNQAQGAAEGGAEDLQALRGQQLVGPGEPVDPAAVAIGEKRGNSGGSDVARVYDGYWRPVSTRGCWRS